MIVQQDSLEHLKTLEDSSIDHIITDPPYLIDFMGKGWDSEDNVAGSVEFWKEALRVCKSGSYALVFGHSRTHHRVMVAMEDAGWEIRDTIMWLYGSGFPKSHNLGGGWGSALKPAYEPIIMARKPFKGSLENNWKTNGLGGLNIDACRIGTEPIVAHHSPAGTFAGGEEGRGSSKEYYTNTGRFPANIILDEEAGKLLDEQAPKTGNAYKATRKKKTSGGSGDSWTNGGKEEGEDNGIYDGLGGASRFFYCAKVSGKERNYGCDEMEEKKVIYRATHNGTGEPSKGQERFSSIKKNHHPTIKPLKLMEYLIKLVSKEGQTILDPFAGSGSTGLACKNLNRNYILVEREEEYIEIIKARLGNKERVGNL